MLSGYKVYLAAAGYVAFGLWMLATKHGSQEDAIGYILQGFAMSGFRHAIAKQTPQPLTAELIESRPFGFNYAPEEGQ